MYRSEFFFGPNGTSLRAKAAKRYDGKGPKRPQRNPAGGAHFSGQLTNPCIYDMLTPYVCRKTWRPGRVFERPPAAPPLFYVFDFSILSGHGSVMSYSSIVCARNCSL